MTAGLRRVLPIHCEEYRIVYERVYPCTSINLMQFNLYFSKKTSSITELKGNFTFKIPMDDNFTLDVNFASWDSIGGWKPNAVVYIAKNACSSFKNVLGNVWHELVKAFNFPSTIYPWQVIKNKENTILGCGVIELTLIRPWENPT
ncbi:uncharacterized protein LOC132953638 [Metopolophium dirhodum]|uniref:uncharacterized protein LOC132953638 n=1 Tax=Metopolophium dirhodum TaxID=44670 RepID=UPI00298F473A|nr:uncharacterized protein LOC132953638 [Metopolophium dirhodum]